MNGVNVGEIFNLNTRVCFKRMLSVKRMKEQRERLVDKTLPTKIIRVLTKDQSAICLLASP